MAEQHSSKNHFGLAGKSNTWKITHGHCTTIGKERGYTLTYKTWSSIKYRCCNVKAKRFHDYGGRGITLCAGWHDFGNFLADMGEKPEGTSIDRIDNDKGYWCGRCEECLANNRIKNCRWATPKEQCNNRKNNLPLTFNGKTQTVAMWAGELGINPITIYSRLRLGKSTEQALIRPKPRKKRKSHDSVEEA